MDGEQREQQLDARKHHFRRHGQQGPQQRVAQQWFGQQYSKKRVALVFELWRGGLKSVAGAEGGTRRRQWKRR